MDSYYDNFPAGKSETEKAKRIEELMLKAIQSLSDEELEELGRLIKEVEDDNSYTS